MTRVAASTMTRVNLLVGLAGTRAALWLPDAWIRFGSWHSAVLVRISSVVAILEQIIESEGAIALWQGPVSRFTSPMFHRIVAMKTVRRCTMSTSSQELSSWSYSPIIRS